MSPSILSNEQPAAPVASGSEGTGNATGGDPAQAQGQWAQFVAQFDFLVPGASLPNLVAATKEAAIRSLVDSLVRAGALPGIDREELVQAILRREELGTTGVGEGVAMPHAKHAGVAQVVGAMGYSAAGVDFHSVDNRPVHLVILLVSPQGASREHLLALESISRRLLDPVWDRWHTPRP